MSLDHSGTLIRLTAEVVSAYVRNNNVQHSNLPELISNTHRALADVCGAVEEPTPPRAGVPAVPIRKSITAETIICLEDGREFRSLRRHLRETYGMTPEDYRRKWGLPKTYPMVAPAYSAKRSALAKASGLGRKPGQRPAKRTSSRKQVSARA